VLKMRWRVTTTLRWELLRVPGAIVLSTVSVGSMVEESGEDATVRSLLREDGRRMGMLDSNSTPMAGAVVVHARRASAGEGLALFCHVRRRFFYVLRCILCRVCCSWKWNRDERGFRYSNRSPLTAPCLPRKWLLLPVG